MENLQNDRCTQAHTAESGVIIPMIRWEMLRKLMEYQGISFTALSQSSGTPVSTLKKLFSGATKDPRISTMLPPVRALGASFDRLLGLAPARDFDREDATYDATLMDNMRQNVESMQGRLDEKRERIDELSAQLAASEADRDRLRKLVLEKGEALSAAQSTIDHLQALVNDNAANRRQSDKQSDELRDDFEKVRSTLYKEREEHKKLRVALIVMCGVAILLLAASMYFLWEATHPYSGNFGV